MGFVQTAFLSALAALAIPIIIHLMFRRRARRVDLGTLRFLQIVLIENARRKKLKRWLLLALRCACLALLAALFARPYLIAREPDSNDRLLVLLVDRSASMGLESGRGRLLSQAISEAKNLLNACGEGTQVEVALFDHAVHPVGGETSNEPMNTGAAEVKDLFAKLRPPAETFSSTDYAVAMAWARDLCVKSTRARKEIHIFTDLQRSGLDRSEAEPLPPDVNVQLVDLGQAYAKNLAVTNVKLQSSTVRPGDAVTITATLFNAGPLPLEKVPVVLHLDNKDKKHDVRQQVNLEPDATATVEFELPNVAEGIWRGFIAAEVDGDPRFDNRRYLAFAVARPVEVLLVDGDPGSSPLASESFFLESALRLAPPGESFADSPFVPHTVSFGEALPDLSESNLVVLANVARLSAGDARRLGDFVERGGGLLVFTGKNVEGDAVRSLAAVGLSVGEITGVASAAELPWRFETWDQAHAAFRPFNDPEHGDLRRLAFNAFTRIRPSTEARVLARFRGGEPALLERTHGRGRVLWFTSACDREWSDWPRSRLFLPMIHQLLGYLAGLTDGGPVRHALIDAIDATGSNTGAEGSPGTEPSPGIFVSDRILKVVNVNPRESEMDRCSAEEFAERFGFRLEEKDRPHEQSESQAVANFDLRPDEIWHWLILGLISVLLAENFLGNRTAA